jgi:hypothetical protein
VHDVGSRPPVGLTTYWNGNSDAATGELVGTLRAARRPWMFWTRLGRLAVGDQVHLAVRWSDV